MTQKEYRCQACDAAFESKEELEIHNRTMHERYRCEICGKTFRSESELKTHIWISHPEEEPVR